MALRADGSGDYAIRTSGGFLSPPLSVGLWLLLEAAETRLIVPWMLRQSGGDHYLAIVHADSDGDTYGWWRGNLDEIALDPAALSLNTWYFFAISWAGTGTNQVTAYRRTASQSGFSSVVTGTFGAGNAPGEETVLTNGFNLSGGWFPGRISGLKQWGAALTADDLLAESYQYAPARFADLHSWRPMIHGAVADAALDFSGNGRDLTPNGSLLIADGPPILWRQGRRRYFLPSAAGGSTVNADARIFARSQAAAIAAVERVSAARIAAGSRQSAQSAVARVASARIAQGAATRAAPAAARIAQAVIAVRSGFRGLALVAREGAAKLLARTGLSARFFQDTTPIVARVSVTPVTRAAISNGLVTRAVIGNALATRAKITVSLGG